MSDRELRELERRWRETGAVEDEAAWLQARLRLGELTPERLELAAHLGHPAALAAVGAAHPPPADVPALLAWSGRLREWGWEPGFRAGLAHGRLQLERLRRGPIPAELEGHVQACRTLLARRLEALEDWLLERAASEPAAPQHALSFLFSAQGIVPAPPATGAQAWIARSYLHGLTAADALAVVTAGQPLGAVRTRGWWEAPDLELPELLELRDAIRAEVAPWALGSCDPLRLRLQRLELASPCNADWASMQGDDRVRRCDQCRLDVYDLEALGREGAEALIRERQGRVCVRLFQRADGRVLAEDCPAGLQDVLEPYRLQPRQHTLGRIRIV